MKKEMKKEWYIKAEHPSLKNIDEENLTMKEVIELRRKVLKNKYKNITIGRMPKE